MATDQLTVSYCHEQLKGKCLSFPVAKQTAMPNEGVNEFPDSFLVNTVLCKCWQKYQQK